MTSPTLFNEFKIFPGDQIDIHDKHGNSSTNENYSLQISMKNAQLLSLGYLRLHCDTLKNIQYEDIASILFEYVAMPIEYSALFFTKKKPEETYHNYNTLIIETELSHDSDFVKHLLNATKHVKLSKLRTKLAVNNCVAPPYGKIGYSLQYGLIELPKTLYNKQNNNQFDFSKQIQQHEQFTDNNCVDAFYLNCICEMGEYYTHVDVHYLCMGCVKNGPQYWATFGQNQKWSVVSLHENSQYVNEYCLQTNDFIDMCFEKDENTSDTLYMYFIKNGDAPITPKKSALKWQNQWDNGRFKLDLKNNYYYIGLSSPMCSCKDGGITFEMTVHEY